MSSFPLLVIASALVAGGIAAPPPYVPTCTPDNLLRWNGTAPDPVFGLQCQGGTPPTRVTVRVARVIRRSPDPRVTATVVVTDNNQDIDNAVRIQRYTRRRWIVMRTIPVCTVGNFTVSCGFPTSRLPLGSYRIAVRSTGTRTFTVGTYVADGSGPHYTAQQVTARVRVETYAPFRLVQARGERRRRAAAPGCFLDDTVYRAVASP